MHIVLNHASIILPQTSGSPSLGAISFGGSVELDLKATEGTDALAKLTSIGLTAYKANEKEENIQKYFATFSLSITALNFSCPGFSSYVFFRTSAGTIIGETFNILPPVNVFCDDFERIYTVNDIITPDTFAYIQGGSIEFKVSGGEYFYDC